MLLYLLVSFLICGWAQVASDLGRHTLDRPGWALRPSISGALFAGATWFLRPIFQIKWTGAGLAKSIVYGGVGVTLQWLSVALVLRACGEGAALLTDITIFRIIAFLVLAFVGFFILMPLLRIPMALITLIVLTPVGWFFARPSNIEVAEDAPPKKNVS